MNQNNTYGYKTIEDGSVVPYPIDTQLPKVIPTLPKIVILHYKKLIDRKQHIIEQLDKHYITDYTFYEYYDQDELDEKTICDLYKPKFIDPDKWTKKVSLWGEDALVYHNPLLNIAEISVTIKFGKLFQELRNQTFDYCIIFEDDVVLAPNFKESFFHYLNLTPSDWDAIYFGSCYNLRSENLIEDKIIYYKNHPASRGGASTILKHKTINDLADTWFPFNLVSDWELSAQHKLHNHKVYWWEPPLTTQGSETGIFKSTLR